MNKRILEASNLCAPYYLQIIMIVQQYTHTKSIIQALYQIDIKICVYEKKIHYICIVVINDREYSQYIKYGEKEEE